MVAKKITFETCGSDVYFTDVYYYGGDVIDGFITFSVSLTIQDFDRKKIDLIRETNLLAGRYFCIADGAKGIDFGFTYPVSLIKTAIF